MMARAAVFRGIGLPFDLVEWPIAGPVGTEVLVQVIACTLCSSDAHSVHGRRSVPVPTILGHEILGRIVAFGPEASRSDAAGRALGEGDRVTWAVVASCGACPPCRRDLPQKCEHGFKYGHEPIRPARELSGGLASHVSLVPGTAIFRVPAEVSDEAACPSSCATATVAAALDEAGPIAGRTVLILGAGMLGLTAAAWCRTLGAAEVIVTDPDETRRDAAIAFGATRVVGPTALDDLVAGSSVDVAFELSGAPEAIESALPRIAIGGRLILVGSVFPGRPVALDAERIVRGCVTIRGVHNYAPRHLGAALGFLAANPSFPFARLVAPWRRLDEVDTLFATAPPSGILRFGVTI